MSEAEELWYISIFPNDLGDGNHRWSWLVKAKTNREHLPEGVANFVPTKKDILWLHKCGDKFMTGWIDLTTGTRHSLVNEDPLEIQPSVLCPAGCGDHGYIRNGKWVSV